MSFSDRGNQEDSQRPLRRAVETTINSSTTWSFRTANIPSHSSSFSTPTRGGGEGGGVLSIGRASGRIDPVSPDSVAVFNDSFRQGEEQQRPPSRAGSSSGGRHDSNNVKFVHGGTSPTPKLSETLTLIGGSETTIMPGSKDPFGLSSFIAPSIVQYLGVRSLVRFGATSKFHKAVVLGEVERRKKVYRCC